MTLRKNIADIQRKILDVRIENFGNEHKLTIDIREKLSLTLENLGFVKDANKLRRENLNALAKIMNSRALKFSANHEITLDAMRNYAEYLEKHKRYEDSAEIRHKICDIYEKKFPRDRANLKIITSLEKIAELLETKTDFDAAVIYRQKIVRLLKSKFPHFDFAEDIINALKKLVRLNELRRDFYAAVIVQNEIVKLLERRYRYKNHGILSSAKSELSTLREMKFNVLNNVIKGQKFNLTRSNPKLSKLVVIFNWESSENFSIEHSAYIIGTNNKINSDKDIITSENPVYNAESVTYVENPAQINVDLNKLPTQIKKIAFTLAICNADSLRQNFSQLDNLYIYVVDAQANEEILRFDLKSRLMKETAIIAGEIYRYKNEWKFNALGSGFVGGISAIEKHFGR